MAKKRSRRVRQPDAPSYWDKRKNLMYLRYVDYIACALSDETLSLIDIGSRSCPYLDWFPWVEDRASLDLHQPYAGFGVRPVTADFLAWEPDKRYDLVLCLQVLEHIPDVAAFAAKLLTVGDHLIVSVPYRWKRSAASGHAHNPIDKAKFLSWFPQPPDYLFVVREPLSVGNTGARIVAYFDTVAPRSKRIFRRRGLARTVLAKREPVSFIGSLPVAAAIG